MKTARQLDREIADHQERDQLTRRVQKLLDKWQPIIGVHVPELHIRKMRAFGSMNVRDGRLWVSQALAQMSPADLEYVIVHELVHYLLHEKGSGHDATFYALMDRFLPSWRRRHARLTSADGRVARPLPGMDR
jgi:predicted metal-dependent hydrolase